MSTTATRDLETGDKVVLEDGSVALVTANPKPLSGSRYALWLDGKRQVFHFTVHWELAA